MNFASRLASQRNGTCGKRRVQRGLFAKLPHGAPAPIYILGGRFHAMLLYPSSQIVPRRELAAGKKGPQTFWAVTHKPCEKIFGAAIYIREQGQIEWVSVVRQSIDLHVVLRRVVQNDDTGKMN